MIVKEMNKLMQDFDGEQEEIDEESVFSTITSNIGVTLAKSIRKGLEGEPLLGKESSRVIEKSIVIGKTNGNPGGVESFDRVHAATVPVKVVQHMINLGKERNTEFPISSAPSFSTYSIMMS
ncbi:hypothetical protein Btru_009587, partial [Bulinus truncatus]